MTPAPILDGYVTCQQGHRTLQAIYTPAFEFERPQANLERFRGPCAVCGAEIIKWEVVPRPQP